MTQTASARLQRRQGYPQTNARGINLFEIEINSFRTTATATTQRALRIKMRKHCFIFFHLKRDDNEDGDNRQTEKKLVTDLIGMHYLRYFSHSFYVLESHSLFFFFYICECYAILRCIFSWSIAIDSHLLYKTHDTCQLSLFCACIL